MKIHHVFKSVVFNFGPKIHHVFGLLLIETKNFQKSPNLITLIVLVPTNAYNAPAKSKQYHQNGLYLSLSILLLKYYLLLGTNKFPNVSNRSKPDVRSVGLWADNGLISGLYIGPENSEIRKQNLIIVSKRWTSKNSQLPNPPIKVSIFKNIDSNST